MSALCQVSIETVDPAEFGIALAPDPVAGKDCVEVEHADSNAEKTAMAVSRGRFTDRPFKSVLLKGSKAYVARGRLTSFGGGE
jgi:hypothetical protein